MRALTNGMRAVNNGMQTCRDELMSQTGATTLLGAKLGAQLLRPSSAIVRGSLASGPETPETLNNRNQRINGFSRPRTRGGDFVTLSVFGLDSKLISSYSLGACVHPFPGSAPGIRSKLPMPEDCNLPEVRWSS